jgi:ribosome-associated toxin RatA of RatAB toxin-antitoxin module
LFVAASANAALREELAPYLPFKPSAAEWRELESGKDLYRLGPGRGVREGLVIAIIASSPERVFEVVTANEDFDEFMPYVAVSFLEEGAGGSLVNYQCLDLPFPISNRYYRVRLTNTEPTEEDPVWRSTWTFVSGNLASNEGSWTLMRTSENTTRVIYQVFSDLGGNWKWINNLATEKGLRPLMESVRRRAAEPDYGEPRGGVPGDCESPSG